MNLQISNNDWDRFKIANTQVDWQFIVDLNNTNSDRKSFRIANAQPAANALWILTTITMTEKVSE